MGLFDFLKNKPDEAPTPTPPAADGAAPAAKAGPRYQGSSHVAPPPPVPATPAPLASPPPPQFPYEPENILEQLMLMAPTDENARPAFYQALLQENILMVLAPAEDITPGEVVLAEGQQIQLQMLQDGKLPIFTSETRLSDGGMDASGMSWVSLPGQAFFAMTQGQDCVLNPFSPAGKLMPAPEIAALLAGQLTQGGNLPADAQVTLSTPDPLPDGLADALTAYGTANPTITAIYVAQMQLVEQSGQPPRLLLGFETTTADPDFMQQLGPVLEGHTANFQHVDLMLIDVNSDEGVNPYFRQPGVEPVYRA